MKYQVLFSLKKNEKVFINVVCYSRDWPFKGLFSVSAANNLLASWLFCMIICILWELPLNLAH